VARVQARASGGVNEVSHPIERALPDARGALGIAWRQLRLGRAAELALWTIPPISALVGCLSLSTADEEKVGDLGLVSAVPASLFVCLALLTVGFALALQLSPRRRALLGAYLLVLVLLLHGAPALIEREPRFPTAWLHAGFADYIGHTGTTLPSLDARFNWPGFFAATGFLTRALGLQDPTALLRWAPLVFELAALVPVYVIAAGTTDDSRVPWLATWLFIPANWVGQDYFSPQALAFALFLGFVVVLARYFQHGAALRPLAVRARWYARAHDLSLFDHRGPAGSLGAPTGASLLGLLLLTYCAVVWSHQLTPYFAIAGATALVLLGACRLRSLPLLLWVIAAAFLSYLAVPYWAGHLKDIFGGVGDVSSTVSANVGGRVSGSATHEWVQRLRILLTATVWGLAFAGAALRWRRGNSSIFLLVLFVTPYSVLAVQSYGGEALMRCYLFSLPFAAALMAGALASPGGARSSVVAPAATIVVSATIVLAFFVARFGNEAFEMVRPGDISALHYLYGAATPGSTLVSVDENVPWRFAGITRFHYATVPIKRRSPQLYVRYVRRAIGPGPPGGYLVFTRGQIEYARLQLGAGRGWVARTYGWLGASRWVRLVYSNAEARVYRFDPIRG
jgi:hypothetical protein